MIATIWERISLTWRKWGCSCWWKLCISNAYLFIFYRGGVLEPAGTVEIKFRKKDLVKAMRRLDDKYNSLSQTLAAPGETYSSNDCARAMCARTGEHVEEWMSRGVWVRYSMVLFVKAWRSGVLFGVECEETERVLRCFLCS